MHNVIIKYFFDLKIPANANDDVFITIGLFRQGAAVANMIQLVSLTNIAAQAGYQISGELFLGDVVHARSCSGSNICINCTNKRS